MALLIDVGAVPDTHCNDCLESLFKALAEEPAGRDDGIWRSHENPYIAAHVEDVTRRLQAALQAIQDAMARLLTGERIGTLAKALAPPWQRWQPAEFEAARMRLEAIPPDRYTLDDWMLVVDYLVQRYLPDDVIRSEAEYLAVRAMMLGKVQANMAAERPRSISMESLAALVPTEFAKVPERVLTPVERQIMAVARARAAQHIGSVTEGVRASMKRVIIEHVQAQVLGQKEGNYKALATRLFDGFGTLNRDMRRIAVTEAGEACNNGFIAASKHGSKVRRQEAYHGACEFCRSINGKTFKVVDPAGPAKNGETEVWLGKNNVGRSAAPRKRAGGALIEREPDELWWPAAGVQHPHCRGAWVAVAEAPPKVDPEFATWLDGLIAGASRIPKAS